MCWADWNCAESLLECLLCAPSLLSILLSIQFRLTLCSDWCGWDDSILAIGSELELSSAEIVQIVSANAQLFFF